MGTELIIDDNTQGEIVFPGSYGRGYVERDFRKFPASMFEPPSEMPIIDEAEWDERIRDKVATQSQLSDILKREKIPSLDQGQNGYCWAHSSTGCVIAARAKAHLPYVPLSATGLASIIKNGRDEGGWCGESAEKIRSDGIPSTTFFPQDWRERQNWKKYYTAEMKANALLHRSTEEWIDIAKPIYDQNLLWKQLITCLLNNNPCAVDFNWWSHSVLAVDAVDHDTIRCRNSWSDSYGELGFFLLRGNRARPDGAICIRSVTASVN
jgi:C1A family cysteine protease